jgi:SEFIR domain
MSGLARPSALVSWSHSSPGWTKAQTAKRRAAVARFTDLLRRRGIDADVDLYHLSESVDWTRWGPQRITEVDRVLVVVSEGWRLAWEGTGDPSAGSGAAAEADTLLSVYAENREVFLKKVRLVVFPGGSADEIPKRLHGVPRFQLRAMELDALDEVIRDLTNQPAYVIKALGPVAVMPPIPTEPAPRATSRANAALKKERTELLAALRALPKAKPGVDPDEESLELVKTVNERLRAIRRQEVTPEEWSRRREHWGHADRLIAKLDEELGKLEAVSRDAKETKMDFDKLAQNAWQTYLWFQFHLGVLVTKSTRKESEEDYFDEYVECTLESSPRYKAAYKPTRALLNELLKSGVAPGNPDLIEQTSIFRSGITEVVDAVVVRVRTDSPPPNPADIKE